MINKITEQSYPDLWNEILDDIYELIEKEHRKGSSFYANQIFEINEEFFPNNSELHGFWMSNTLIWDADYGCDRSDITELYRVEKKKVIVEKEEWSIVQ